MLSAASQAAKRVEGKVGAVTGANPAAASDPAPAKAPKAPAKVTSKATAPTAGEIQAAQAKGLVWVNLNTGIYHKDGAYFGKTKNGKFMTESEAQQAGHRAAGEPAKHAATKDAKERTKAAVAAKK